MIGAGSRASADDRGSVLILALGFLAVLLTAVAVVTDVTSMYLQRRALAALADGAALAGSQAVDLSSYYRRGAAAGLAPDRTRVRGVVLDYLDASRDEIRGFRVDSVRVEGRTVLVDVRREATAPFSGLLGATFSIRVEAGAQMNLG